jgi:hypothetical protein
LFSKLFRQYREQLRQQRVHQQPPQAPQPVTGRLGYVGGMNGSIPSINGSNPSVNGSTPSSHSSSTNELSQNLSEKLQLNNPDATNNEINRFKSFDVKAMQKEAVLSYVKVINNLKSIRGFLCVEIVLIERFFPNQSEVFKVLKLYWLNSMLRCSID